MKDLLPTLQTLLNTELILPSVFENLSLVCAFSKKLPYPFDFELLKSLNSFRFFFPKQIHSTKIIELKDTFSQDLCFFKIEGDAVFTTQRHIFIGVRTADCVPILITNKSADFVGVVHGGWRGSVNKLLFKFLQKIIGFGYKPEDILIAIGPHVKACCYEVGKDVVEVLKQNFENAENFLVFKNKKIFLDLEKLNYYQALNCSIPPDNIWVSKDCTCCLNKYYWSHRFHKGKRGFQISFIGKLR
ncbi:MAG: peptidoglycan editing factor PgeF [Thermodesulfobacterium sp.]|nr:peptidoglycan editing factor PgeF [Thermodesulfobacterium sp.]